MIKIKKYCLKLLPYLLCTVTACAFWILGNNLNADIKGLMHGIAGSFLSIPVLYLIYELSKNYSLRKLNKELFDYAKMQIDSDVLSIINQLMKVVLPYEEVTMSPEGIRSFLSQTESDLASKMRKNEYLGFQVFKNWSITERNITKILENSFILQHLESDQLIAIIDLLKEIRSFEFMPANVDDLYFATDKTAKGYRLETGENLNYNNIEFPDRYLLLKHLEADKFVVRDFGDFALYQRGKLLNTYRVNAKHINHFATSLLRLIKSLSLWVKLTGHEFVIDTKLFRPSTKRIA